MLKAIAESACEVCDAYDAVVFAAGWQRLAFQRAPRTDPAIEREKWPINRHSDWRVAPSSIKQPVHLHDLLDDENRLLRYSRDGRAAWAIAPS